MFINHSWRSSNASNSESWQINWHSWSSKPHQQSLLSIEVTLLHAFHCLTRGTESWAGTQNIMQIEETFPVWVPSRATIALHMASEKQVSCRWIFSGTLPIETFIQKVFPSLEKTVLWHLSPTIAFHGQQKGVPFLQTENSLRKIPTGWNEERVFLSHILRLIPKKTECTVR